MCRHQILPLLALTFTLGAVPARLCHAQWQVNGAPVCTNANASNPTIAPDGTGGAIVTWMDYRSGTNWDIYAQRLNAAGEPQWTADGVALCTDVAIQVSPQIITDGAGGAIVTWLDVRSGTQHIYAQRVNAAGATQWTADGVELCTAANTQYYPAIVPDGAGGAIVTWEDYRSWPGGGSISDYADIYAQRVNAAGALQWTADGVAVCALATGQFAPTIASDGAGGAIVTWYDTGDFGDFDVFAQRVSAAGAGEWALGGVMLCTTVAGHQFNPTIIPDGVGGAIVAWMDQRAYPVTGIYAQRVDADGTPQWTAAGAPFCTAGGVGNYLAIASDQAGGAIVTWHDSRNGTNDIFAQRVSGAGAPQWTTDGLALCTAANDQFNPTITSDGAGGAIVTWADGRTGVGADLDIYAQRVNAAGVPQWTACGVALCTAAGSQSAPTIISDGADGAIVTWHDWRNRGVTPYAIDIYAQRVFGSGGVVAVSPPSAPAHFQLLALSPNPTRDGQMTIRFNLPSSERVSSEVLDLGGRRVRTLATDREFPPGTQALAWDGRSDAGVSLPYGVYFVEVRVGTHSEARRAVLLH